MNFITCPFCSGHEQVSSEAMRELAMMLSVREFGNDQVTAELLNIRNVLTNTLDRLDEEDRRFGQPHYGHDDIPICPTPDKAKYGDAKHAAPNATKYKQHPYQCECGYWHLSKQTPAQHASKVNSPAASADEFDSIDPLML